MCDSVVDMYNTAKVDKYSQPQNLIRLTKMILTKINFG